MGKVTIHERIDFELYKSAVCHKVKNKGDLNFIKETLTSDKIRKLFKMEWYPESLYLLAMIDYLSREHNIPLCTRYNDIRDAKLEDTAYPAGIKLMSYVYKSDEPKKQSLKEAIPEFLRHNIVEAEIRNVC